MSDTLVFIDESGDVGRFSSPSSSNRFVISAIAVGRADADLLIEMVRQAKAIWRKKELKFSCLNQTQRREIFSQLSTCPFSAYSLVVEKSLLYSKGFLYTDVFFKFFFDKLLSLLEQRFTAPEIYFDQFGNQKFQDGLRKYIHRRHKDSPLFEPKVIASVDSRLSELTQVADLVAGAVARATGAHKQRKQEVWFVAQLAARQKELVFWPKRASTQDVPGLQVNQNDVRLANESERRIRLAATKGKSGDLESSIADLLLYSDGYISSSQVINELQTLEILSSH